LYENQLEREAWKSLGRGVYKGTARALKKWDDFLMRLGHEPRKTIGKIAQDVKALGTCLGYAAAELSEHIPYAYKADIQLDLIEDVMDLFKNGKITSGKRRFLLRAERNKAAIENGAAAVLNASLDVISNMAAKSFENNIADITEFGVDALITAKATEAVMQLAQFTSNVLLQGGREILEVIPTNLLDSPVAYMQTSIGEIIAVAEKTAEDINIVASKQIAVNRAAKIARGEELTHEVQKLTQANPTRIAKLKAKFEKYYRSDVLLPGLEKIEGVKQIDNYRVITKNFTTIEQLTEADVMYLNMCNGLHAHSVEINNLVEKAMLYVVDQNGKIIEIKKFDIYHSFLGEMRPGATSYAKRGGHILFPESKAFTHVVEEIIPFENGYFDLAVKHINDKGKTMLKTQFPLGSTPVENAQLIIDLIQEVKVPYFIKTDSNGITTCDFLKQCGQKFTIYVEDGIAHYHPISKNIPSRSM